MGWGDEIMAAGCAEEVSKSLENQPVSILDKYGNIRWSDIWEYNPYIYHPKTQKDISDNYIINGPGARPYLKSLSKNEGAVFTKWRARDHKGHIFFSNYEKDCINECKNYLSNFYLIEPNISSISNPNKQWGFEKWQELAYKIKKIGLRLVQPRYTGARLLDGVEYINTNTFRDCCGLVSIARCCLLNEGGTHHAAGVLDIPAVVFFGGHISPQTTGYEHHINVYPNNENSPCGSWVPCKHCKDVADSVSVDDMLNYFFDALEC